MRKLTDKYLGMVTGLETIDDGLWKGYDSAKSEFLRGLFGGETIIEKEVQVAKTQEDMEESIRNSGLIRLIKDSFDEKVKQFAENYRYVSSYQRTMRDELEVGTMEVIRIFSNSYRLGKQVMDYNITFVSPITDKTIKIQSGTKISRILKHLITDKEKLNKAQVLYSQVLNDKLLTGTLCLSIHPMDYLTASVNKAGWSSCYDTLDKGAYCASTLCLLNSPNTIMVYLKAKEDGVYRSYSSDTEVEWNSKKWRTYATFTEDLELVHFGNNYPYANVPLMEEAKKMIQELTEKTYLDIDSDTRTCFIHTPANMYNDAAGRVLYSCYTQKYIDGLNTTCNPVTISIAEAATCPECGEDFSDVAFDLRCGTCGDYPTCEYCGDVVGDGSGTYVEGVGILCECCYDNNAAYCEHCGEYHLDSHMVEYHYYNSYTNSMSSDYICEGCAETSDCFIVCDCCGYLTDHRHVNDEGLCRDCQPAEEE